MALSNTCLFVSKDTKESDAEHALSHRCRSLFLVAAAVLQTAAAASLAARMQVGTLYATAVISGAACGATFTLMPALTSEVTLSQGLARFGKHAEVQIIVRWA